MAWNEYSLLAELCEATLSVTSPDHREFSSLEWVTIQQTQIIHFLLEKYTQSIASLKTAIVSLIREKPSVEFDC